MAHFAVRSPFEERDLDHDFGPNPVLFEALVNGHGRGRPHIRPGVLGCGPRDEPYPKGLGALSFQDSLFEARPDGGEAYGELELSRRLHDYRSLPPREAARLIIRSIREHRAADLADDATLVIVDLPSGDAQREPSMADISRY